MIKKIFSRHLFGGLIACMTCLTIVPAYGEQVPSPEKVITGMFVNNIHSIDLKSNNFMVDFYIWFRWKKKGLKPHETFEIINGEIESKTNLDQKTINGEYFATYRVLGRIYKNWDVRKYPLDDHHIQIGIEDSVSPASSVIYVADKDNTNLSTTIDLPSWKLSVNKIWASEIKYLTNYGDPTIPSNAESRFSRFNLEVDMQRKGFGYFFKLFSMLFVATGVCFLSFRIRATDLDPRFGLPIGAIFAAAASEFTVVAGLPETNDITMADWLHINSMLFIMLTIFSSTIALKLCNRGLEEKAIKLDRRLGIFLPFIYFVVVILIVGSPISQAN